MSSENTIQIRQKPRQLSRGLLRIGSQLFECALGRNGMTMATFEGDGATPIGTVRPLYGFYRPDRERKPRSSLPFFPIRQDMGWCDDCHHPSYNRLIKLPFSESHEIMWREDHLYDLVIVLDINVTRRTKNRGSAIFMHVARPGYAPSEGCIALNKKDLRLLLNRLSPQTRVQVTR